MAAKLTSASNTPETNTYKTVLKHYSQIYLNTMCLPYCLLCADFFPYMFGISSIYRCFPFVALAISAFILGFLLIGGASTNPTYSSVFLIKAAFNLTSPLVESPLNSTATSIVLKANYLALCVSSENQLLCSPSKNFTALQEATSISVGPANFSLVDVAQALTEVCKPYLLISCIILTMLLLIFVIWMSVPYVPGKFLANKIAAGVSGLTVVIWGLGAMLQQQGVEGAREFIHMASMEMIIVTRGGRAHAMAWTAFAFLLAAFLCIGVKLVREFFVMNASKRAYEKEFA